MVKQKEVDLIRKAFLTAFPNPQRQGCPEKSVLRAIGRDQILLNDPAYQHISGCSPCFKEVLAYGADWKKKRRNWVLLACAVFILLAVLAVRFWKSKY